MECYEKGLLTRGDTGGVELKWGDGDTMINVIGLIATKQGIGNLIAEGSARMARRLGHDSNQFAMCVKG